MHLAKSNSIQELKDQVNTHVLMLSFHVIIAPDQSQVSPGDSSIAAAKIALIIFLMVPLAYQLELAELSSNMTEC